MTTSSPALPGALLIVTLGQVALTHGMGRANAGWLAPFNFFSVVFAAVLGWVSWREPVTLVTWAGVLFILVSAVTAARTRDTGRAGSGRGALAVQAAAD